MRFIIPSLLVSSLAFAQAPNQRQMGIVVAFQDGKVVAAQVIGDSDNLDHCQKGLAEALPEIQAKFPEFILVPVCTPEPPAPQTNVKQSPIKTKPVEHL